MLAEHAELREGFEQRLYDRWKPALDLYEMVLVSCTEVGSDLHRALTDAAAPPSDHPTRLYALTLLHARACLVADEVFALLRTGHAAGAQARWRTLHEIAVIAFVLGSGDNDLAQRFVRHRQVERWKEARCYQENCEALGREPFSEQQMDDFQAGYQTVVNQYEDGYARDWGWSKPLFPSSKHQPNFDDLEKLAGLGHNKPFVRLSHRAIHSSASGAIDIFALYGREKVLLAGASNAHLSDPGHGSLIALSQATVAFLLHGPNQVEADNLLALRGIGLLVTDAGHAFGRCESDLASESGGTIWTYQGTQDPPATDPEFGEA